MTKPETPKTTATKIVDLFSDFAVDDALSQEGVWVNYAGDVEFLVARAGNKTYRKVAQNLYDKNRRGLRTILDDHKMHFNAMDADMFCDIIYVLEQRDLDEHLAKVT